MTDIPEDGLYTEWIISSRDVSLTPAADEPYGDQIDVANSASGEDDQWVARFSLVIPAVGNSEERPFGVTPLTADEPQLEVFVFVGGDIYRKLHITLQVEEESGTTKEPINAVNESISDQEIEQAAVSLSTRRPISAAQTNLHGPHEWQRPKRDRRLLLLPPSTAIPFYETGGSGRESWTPDPSKVDQRIERTRKALDEFRSNHSEYLDDIEPEDLKSRLQSFSPTEWMAPAGRIASRHSNAWERVAASNELRRLADEGYWLFETLFKEGSGLRRWIDELQPGDRIRMIWQSGLASSWAPHIPWPLLYRVPAPEPGDPIDPWQFLGVRYRISYHAHVGPDHGRGLGGMQKTSRAHILYWGPGDTTAEEAARHAEELESYEPLLVPPRDTQEKKAAVCRFLANPKPRPVTLLYFYCRGSAGRGSEPLLRLGSTNATYDVLELVDLGNAKLPDKPIVFLNACDTAASDPFFSSELENRFFERECRAYIGTECKVPIGLAARFSTAFFFFLYTRLDGNQPTSAGEAFTQARKFLWDQYRNLGGLFYSYVNDYDIYVADDDEVDNLR
ncbi:hypothetical protein [Streptomyces sp. NPDC005407]|uniref:hypothetical protein n=1 Tax=Streptomyces sp. NPDC005407 TaxID=3155340 RepID=UPI0033B4FC0C